MTDSFNEAPIQAWKKCRLHTGVADLGVIPDGVVVAQGGRITYVGPTANAPALDGSAEITDLGGRLVTPGLIDCHTHIVHGGNRAREFEMRLEGASYVDIAQAGGGIMSTVRATRELSVDQLIARALPRLDALLAEGLTTIEIKSGYGLTIEAELDMLRAARRLAEHRDVRIVTSYLGAHAVPAEYRGREQDYLADTRGP